MKDLKNKKLILFDLDTTLYEEKRVHEIGLKAAFEVVKDKLNIDYIEFDTLYEEAKAEFMRELAGTASSHSRILRFQRISEKLDKTFRTNVILHMQDAYWDNYIANMQIFDGALKVLKYVKENNKNTALVTNLTAHIQFRKVQALGVCDYVDQIVTSEEAGIEKPNKAIFLIALNKFKLLPEDACMIGDSLTSDIEGANAAGIDSIFLNHHQKDLSNENTEGLRKPDFIIDKIEELLEIL